MSGHKPGPFNAPNKKHKTGGHRSKGQIDRETRGRLGSVCSTNSSKRHLSIGRRDRKSAMLQQRRAKREAVLMTKRSLGGNKQAPILVTILSFDKSRSPEVVLADIKRQTTNEDVYAWFETSAMRHLASMRQKRRFSFITPPMGALHEVLDAVKASDVVLFVWPRSIKESPVEDEEMLITTLIHHGLPTCLHYSYTQQSMKKASDQIDKYIQQINLPFEELRYFNLTQVDEVLRKIAECRKSPVSTQQHRGYLLAENFEVLDIQGGVGKLKLTGHVRGNGFTVNSIIHVPGCGDYLMSHIEVLRDPYSVEQYKKQANGMEDSISVVSTVEATADPYAKNPSEVVPDPLDGEQNIDTDLNANVMQPGEKIKKKVPKGTSAYQAAWIDGDIESGDDEEETESEDEDKEFADGEEAEDVDMEEEGPTRRVTFNDAASVADDFDMDDNDMVTNMDLATMFHKQRENDEFPDEVDTPVDTPARERFQKYRAVPSFKNSAWDPKENLPMDYGRIYHIKNYKHARKYAFGFHERTEEDCFVGAYVNVYLKNFPVHFVEKFQQGGSVLAYELLENEQCMTVMNMRLKKHSSCTVPIKNKQRLIFQVGYRMFEAEPVFSEHGNGDKFKMERFMPEEGMFCATVFAPTMFGTLPVLVFREDASGKQHLCATGVTLDPNPNRIVLKRVVLAAHPYRTKGRSAVARYMFYNKEDVDWFKPVEIYTPTGCRGHITESLGTHGLFKCRFDRPLSSENTIMMSLYKRVFPKWTYGCNVNRSAQLNIDFDNAAPVEAVEAMES
ncbi:hypothetical protein L596_018415 [Steinernema carpocapsae]|uniref:Pre-rRNA-processing protein TSR1 homolog n=1 Tax=Steinernema carpocapsae TaxID=34508 RepID=A0A4U5N5K7_STECR|nr:hypothetical protein L596_018415 [Steinernema carpocapsae]